MGAEDRGWGWPASQRGNIVDLNVAGVDMPGGVNRHVAPIMAALVREFHDDIEQLHTGWCWGYAYRRIRGSVSWSNHAWGLALDLNAPRHPMGSFGTFGGADRRRCSNLAAKYDCRWGGNYSGRKDEMHFEFMGSPASAAQLIDRIDLGQVPAGTGGGAVRYHHEDGDGLLELGEKGHEIERLQRLLNRRLSGRDIDVDGFYGPGTRRAVIRFQRQHGLAVDGIAGPVTLAGLRKGGRPIQDRSDGGAEDAPRFPLPRTHWYGPESSDPHNHSGYWERDRPGIHMMQARLRERGWTIGVDGLYGEQTERVVRRFQREKGLRVDGLTGDRTWPRFWVEPVT